MGHELWQLSQGSLKVTATSCPQEEVEAFLWRAFPESSMCTLYVLVCMFLNAWVHVACMWEYASSCVYGAVWASSGVSGLEQAVSGIQGHSVVAQSRRLSPLLLRVVQFLLSSAAQSLVSAGETWATLLAQPFLQAALGRGTAGIMCPFAHSQVQASSGSLSGEGGQEGEA